MEFKYVATTNDGNEIKGVITAESESNAEQLLWDYGLTIINLKRSFKLPALHEAIPSVFGVKPRDIIQFSRNMASLLEAGIPIFRALTIQSRFGKQAFREVLKEIITDLEKGSRFSEACAKYPTVFPTFYVYLLRTGEETGNLADVLNDTAKHMEKDQATASKVKSSLIYPTFVLLLAIGAIVVMMTFVVPALTSLFSEFGSDLPAMTRGMIAISNFFEANFLYMITIAAILTVAGYFYVRTERGRRRKDEVILRIPMIGQAVLKGGVARFCRNMSMLVTAGVSLFDSLQLTSDTTENALISEAVNGIYAKVGDGQLFSQAVSSEPLFPPLMGEMIAIGEETGSLGEQLIKVSGFYEEEADRAISRVTGMLTPALTIGVGIIIGLVAVTIFGSIYSMVDVLPE
ncbi:MAG: type II secretion system F family protein [Chloroflexota bacterium]|nr:type II secretion system F family protein [Chloroflexota bacterium]